MERTRSNQKRKTGDVQILRNWKYQEVNPTGTPSRMWAEVLALLVFIRFADAINDASLAGSILVQSHYPKSPELEGRPQGGEWSLIQNSRHNLGYLNVRSTTDECATIPPQFSQNT